MALSCKTCSNIELFTKQLCESCYQKAYTRTKDGLVNKIYKGLKGSSKVRGQEFNLLFEDLQDWLWAQKEFHELYSAWAASGYSKHIIPSIDRQDTSLGYQLCNMKLMTWQNNHELESLRKSKRVVQYTKKGVKMETYKSVRQAQIALDKSKGNAICKAALGIVKTAYGFKWEYE